MKSLIIILLLCTAAQAQSIKIIRPGGHVITKHLKDRSIYYRPYTSRYTNRYDTNRFIRNSVTLSTQIQRDLYGDTNTIVYRFRNGTLLRRTPSGQAYIDYTPVWGTRGMESYYRGIIKRR